MKKPKMILFDYGQTLIAEGPFSGLRGTAAVMQYATRNRYNLTPEQVQTEAVAVIKEVKHADPNTPGTKSVEVPNHMFTTYLYESLGITIDLTTEEIDRVFWDAASPGRPTEGMPDFCSFCGSRAFARRFSATSVTPGVSCVSGSTRCFRTIILNI